uniref:Chromosome partition protein Smc n=1 Tax=Candidatus Kentrum sp. DK TaxID=2126562 RepID=A0A450SK44_9GAMM|nr:MAG: condensin subunit Smc [Candidatus Kentron sp. DK]
MFLHRIKLAGFKSFVDPSTIVLPGNLVGIVGPNGCGKSNVADAVRWVMGEISAKHLRGGSMADVVFNGSTARKPVGLAQVEITIDNTEGRVGGQYSAFNEIAIRRQVSRDGQSTYFLNGRRCRRRDVTDVFLGTGLGPRSYAIIEQGMVSRLVEAKPDDLREFLEEAAGVSKYKERRRETENRIAHTRENLERLQDIRDELGKRIAHLKRQATVAEKYKQLKHEERLSRAQLATLHWRTLSGELTKQDRQLGERETALEARVTELRDLESRLDQQRAGHAEAQEAFNGEYRAALDAEAAIARSEENIRNLVKQAERVRKTLESEEEVRKEADRHLGSEKEKIETLEKDLAEGEPELERLKAEAVEAAAEHAKAESDMHESSSSWEAIGLRVVEATQVVRAGEGRIEQLTERLADADKRHARLEQERQKLGTGKLEREIIALAKAIREHDAIRAKLKSQLARHQLAVRDLGRHIEELSSALGGAREQFQDVRGRLSSLTALQQDALGKGEGAVTDWLQACDLTESPRLAEKLEVAEGWERAVEHVLGDRLRAICVDGLDTPLAGLAGLGEGTVTFFDTAAPNPDAPKVAGPEPEQWQEIHPEPLITDIVVVEPIKPRGVRRKKEKRWVRILRRIFRFRRRTGSQKAKRELPPVLALPAPVAPPEPAPTMPPLNPNPLHEKVSAPWPLDSLFAGVRVADSLEEALDLRPALKLGQSAITPEGEWIAANWLRAHRGAGAGAGVLSREREIKTLSETISQLQAEIEGWEYAMAAAHGRRKAAEQEQAKSEKGSIDAEQYHAKLQSAIAQRRARFEEFRRRALAIAHELADLEEQRVQARTGIGEENKNLAEQQAIRDRVIRERDAEAERRKEYQGRLAASRKRWQEIRDKAHQAELRMASLRTRHGALTQSRVRDSEQRKRLDTRCQELRQSLEEITPPLQQAKSELAEHRLRRQELESKLKAAREQVEKQESAVRESDQRRHAVSDRIESDRTLLEKTRLTRQETHVRREGIEEQITASGHAVDTLLAELPEEANEADWTARIVVLEQQVARLGPINLAALQEHAEQSQQKEHMDSQYQDLTDALDTLETAMRDMDRETRNRFADTFEKVNVQLGTLFPRLFGGGHAQLELVGDDTLNAGVTIMARPPGKRNSTIAQLSGGEKALTAVALVFALFELNPAPFCLLDEVDAPLDDANVYRFRDMLEEMSDRVQFLVITHNKNTMEILQQLVGVTMSEPGVSRLVSVDMDRAQDFSEAVAGAT